MEAQSTGAFGKIETHIFPILRFTFEGKDSILAVSVKILHIAKGVILWNGLELYF